MVKHALVVSALVGCSCVVGCEEKKADPAASTTKALGDATKKVGETVKDAGTAAGDAAKKAGETVKDAGAAVGDAAKKAAATVSDETKKLFGTYSTDLGNLSGMLEGIKTKAEAEAKKADVTKAVEAVNGATGSLDKLGADVKAALATSMKAQLDPALKKVHDQIARITGDKDIGAVLGDTLKGLKLFQ